MESIARGGTDGGLPQVLIQEVVENTTRETGNAGLSSNYCYLLTTSFVLGELHVLRY